MAGSALTPVESDDETMLGEVEDRTANSAFVEIGVTWLKRSSGYGD